MDRGVRQEVWLRISCLMPCVRLATGANLETAVGALYTLGTAHHALRDRGDLQAGEVLLVLGAAGAVGLAAVELGASIGATVIAAASSDTKLERCRQHGADFTVNYVKDDLRTRVRSIGTDTTDVVFDPVGGAMSERALRTLAPNGRFLVVGFASGESRPFRSTSRC